MLHAFVRALAVCAVNVGDMCTEVCSTCAICLPEWACLEEIISLLAG